MSRSMLRERLIVILEDGEGYSHHVPIHPFSQSESASGILGKRVQRRSVDFESIGPEQNPVPSPHPIPGYCLSINLVWVRGEPSSNVFSKFRGYMIHERVETPHCNEYIVEGKEQSVPWTSLQAILPENLLRRPSCWCLRWPPT